MDAAILPSIRILIPEGPIRVAMDNCPSHNSHIVRAWFAQNPEVIRIEWPPKSPDLNPIENIFGLLALAWDHAPTRIADELRTQIEIDWDRLRGDPEWFLNLADSMRKRIRDVVECGGHSIGY